MVPKLWIAFLVLAGTMTMAAAQTSNQRDERTSGWTNPVIKDYGLRAWRLPRAAVQPQRGRTYKVIFDLSKQSKDPNEVLDGLAHAARLFNVFAADGVPPNNLKVVAIFHGSAGTLP